MKKDYKAATKGNVLEGADFMNIAVVPSSYSKQTVRPAPRPGTREPEMSDDEVVDMLREKLGPNFGAAMSVPMHQWPGEFKKMSKKMKQRIKAVQSIYNDMQRQGLRPSQMGEEMTEDLVL